MQFEDCGRLWAAYLRADIARTIHDADRMEAHYKGEWDPYYRVGRSGVDVVMTALTCSPTVAVKRVLDFGCGHGRVARHLRGLFPDAELFFADADREAAQFCADLLHGAVAETVRGDFAGLDMPKQQDVIWVGSVFTHISGDRMKVLFDALYRHLAPNGILVATFHGPRLIEVNRAKPVIFEPKWLEIMEGYAHKGIGHSVYGGENGTDNWGVSMSKVQNVFDLSDGVAAATVRAYLPRGWTNFQDVCVWSKG